jgi:hypothetical protein
LSCHTWPDRIWSSPRTCDKEKRLTSRIISPMPQFTQKYAIIQLFEDMPEGTEFPSSNWPLHSTIADTFAIDWDVPTLIKELTELLKNHEQASSVVEDDRFFGDNGEVQVALLQKTDSLVKLHYDV